MATALLSQLLLNYPQNNCRGFDWSAYRTSQCFVENYPLTLKDRDSKTSDRYRILNVSTNSREFDFAIISIAPVPLDKFAVIEGGGLRAWGLAVALAAKNKKVLVLTPQKIDRNQISLANGLSVEHYGSSDGIYEKASAAAAVIISGSHWETAKHFIDQPESRQILIADCYVPIGIETVGHKYGTSQISQEFFEKNLENINNNTNKILNAADYVLCSGENQFSYYYGMALAQNIFSSKDITSNRILNIPMGILPNAQASSVDRSKNRNIGIVGGLYPWLTPSYLPKVLENLYKLDPSIKITLIGSLNPFINPADPIVIYSKKLLSEIRAISANIEIIEWVSYEELTKSYANLGAVLLLNPNAIEAHFSWRTRIIEFISHGIPLITDGSDQIGAFLTERQAAKKISTTDQLKMAEEVVSFFNDEEYRRELEKNLSDAKSYFKYENYIDNFANTKLHKKQKHQFLGESETVKISGISSLRVKLVIKLIQQGQFIPLARVSYNFFLRKIRKFGRRKKYSSNLQAKVLDLLIITPNLGPGGANLVAKELAERGISKNLKVFLCTAGDIQKEFLEDDLPKNIDFGYFNKNIQKININKIVLNSVAHPLEVFTAAANYLKNNLESSVTLYCHEDKFDYWVGEDKFKVIKQMIQDHGDRFQLVTPCEDTALKLDRAFPFANGIVHVFPYSFESSNVFGEFPEKRFENAERLDFYLCGTSSDSRKNHRKAILIFEKVLQNWSNDLRDFRLIFVGVGDDPYSVETLKLGTAALGKKFLAIPFVSSHDDVLKLINKFHVAMSISEHETMPRVISEALLAGQVILRNKTSGLKEQLADGSNGFIIEEDNIEDSSKVILKILDPKIVCNERLTVMGSNSRIMGHELRKRGEISANRLVSDDKSYVEETNFLR